VLGVGCAAAVAEEQDLPAPAERREDLRGRALDRVGIRARGAQPLRDAWPQQIEEPLSDRR
jgi:hypothetical protein